MCWECRILGPLVHLEERSPIDAARSSSFAPSASTEDSSHLIDKSASDHLRSSLDEFLKHTNIRLTPIRVHTDGSCLPHAVSRGLVGKEVLYDALREALTTELKDHRDWYESKFKTGMDDETWNAHFKQVIAEAEPTFGRPTGRWLGPGEHLLALSNALGRPIVLVDELETMRADDHRAGMVVPSRLSREQVLEMHDNVVPSPVFIGWANRSKTHFVSLVAFSNEENADVKARDMLRSLLRPDDSSEVEEMILPMDRSPGDVVRMTDPNDHSRTFEIRVPKDAKPGQPFLGERVETKPSEFELNLINMVESVPSRISAESLRVLDKICTNLFDAVVGADAEKLKKTSKLKTSNKVIARNVINVPHASEALKAVGFVESADGGEFLVYDSSRADMDLITARDCFRNLSKIENHLKPLSDVETLSKLFGPAPLSFDGLTWSDAVELYGYSTTKNSEKIFALGLGKPSTKLANDLVDDLKIRFNSLTKDTEFQVDLKDWDDLFLYNRKITRLRCPKCETEQDWTGDVDGVAAGLHVQDCSKCKHHLNATMTGAFKTGEFLHNILQT